VLHTAVEQHKLALLQQLLVASSKLGCAARLASTPDNTGADCWCIARRQGVTELTELLAAYTATAVVAGPTDTIATTAGDESSSAVTPANSTLTTLTSSSALVAVDLDCADVLTAVSRAHTGCLKQLLARSAPAAAVLNSSMQSPLHLVNHNKQYCEQLTAALLSACPKHLLCTIINAADADDRTPLQLCVREHYDEGMFEVCHKCMRALLAAGADATVLEEYEDYHRCKFNAVDFVLHAAELDYYMPVPESVVAETIVTVKALVAAGCSLSGQLHRALETSSDRGKVRVLLAYGADPFEVSNGFTSMHCAARFHYGGPENKGLYCSDDDETAAAAAAAAVPANVLNIQDLYEAAGAAADLLLHSRAGDAQCTPLHCGARRSSTSVQKLLQLGASVTALDSKGCSALHIACEHRCAESVELLLAAGADPHAYAFSSGKSVAEGQWQPLHYALLKHKAYATVLQAKKQWKWSSCCSATACL
jgi:ankyrin repeat protein